MLRTIIFSRMNNSNLSVGAYFKKRCEDMRNILGKTDSPDRSSMPSICEGEMWDVSTTIMIGLAA